MKIILRFVAGTSLVSRAIIAQEKTALPFTPSHVEARIVKNYVPGFIGSHLDGGVQWRQEGYDFGTFSNELLLEIPVSDEQQDTFEKYMWSIVGEEYDFAAIFGFVLPEHFHMLHHVICSAACALGLRKCRQFDFQLAAPAHLISPRDLLLCLSATMQIPGI